MEHMHRAHIQANMWHQDMVLNPTCLAHLNLEVENLDQKLVPVLSQVAPALVSVLQLVRCSCEKSKGSRRFSCREINTVCTELCQCDLTRFNKIAIQGTPQMAVDKEAICLSRVYSSISIIWSSFGNSLSWKAARGRHAPLRNLQWRQLSTWRRQYKVGILMFDL